MSFPARIYTDEEVRRAKEFIDKGYKHRLRVKGSTVFRKKVRQALELVRAADYYTFLRTYIRGIDETDGLTQLRNADAVIWANRYAVESPVDAASVFVQKAYSMREYLELRRYYDGEAEKRSVEKRLEFINTLKNRSTEKEVIVECKRLLELWRDNSLVY